MHCVNLNAVQTHGCHAYAYLTYLLEGSTSSTAVGSLICTDLQFEANLPLATLKHTLHTYSLIHLRVRKTSSTIRQGTSHFKLYLNLNLCFQYWYLEASLQGTSALATLFHNDAFKRFNVVLLIDWVICSLGSHVTLVGVLELLMHTTFYLPACLLTYLLYLLIGFIPYVRLNTKYTHTHTKSHRYMQIHANARNYIQIHTSTHKYMY